MRLPRARPARGRILRIALLLMSAGLPAACSAGPAVTSASSATPIAPTAANPATAGTAAAAAAAAFTISGSRPVPPNGSQDTHAATPEAACDSATFTADEAVGTDVADGFAVAGFPAAASLLTHFLHGTGTEIDYRAGSLISAQARASSAFRSVNATVLAEIAQRLRSGGRRIGLSARQLPTVAFESQASDLYWGFRGTQGLSVTGSGRRANGRYTGTLTYVIRDSYGFPADDTLDGFGPPMRYLQTVCGAPQHTGGARWFPDAITVTVTFDRAVTPA